jgi:MFS family permease
MKLGTSSQSALERSIARATRRLVPFLLLMWVISFLDRINISFAKNALELSAGISDSAYALGAGLFFVTYAVFGVPSNIILHRVGARAWMSCMMISWGIVSMATAFIAGHISFYILRLMLGITEAGFFPGVILYLTYWFPNAFKGRVIGLFYFGPPLAFIVGGPLSGTLMQLPEIWDLQGWQWMFLIEGSLAAVVGAWAFWYLDSVPADAVWIPTNEKRALSAELAHEQDDRLRRVPVVFWDAFGDFRVLLFSVIYFLIQASVYSEVFYLPTDIGALLGAPVGAKVGFVSAIPWTCALVGSFFLPRLADKLGNHRQLAALVLAASGLAGIVSSKAGPVIVFISICFSLSGFIAVQPLFWTLSTKKLVGKAAVSGIAIINGVGCLGGFFAPNLRIWIERGFESVSAGLYFLAVFGLLNALLVLSMREKRFRWGDSR